MEEEENTLHFELHCVETSRHDVVTNIIKHLDENVMEQDLKHKMITTKQMKNTLNETIQSEGQLVKLDATKYGYTVVRLQTLIVILQQGSIYGIN